MKIKHEKKYENIFLDWLSNLCQEMIISQRLPSLQTHTHTYTNTHTTHAHNTHAHTLMYTHAYTHSHTQAHTHTHAHTHTYKLTNLIASLLYRFFIFLQPNSQADSDTDRV